MDQLYTGAVSAQNQSESERQRATVEAFKQVLVKVSGSRETLFAAGIQDELSQAERYVQRYSFTERPSDEPTPSTDWFFTASFAPGAVDTLLKTTGQRIWGADRPKILLWLAVQDQHLRRLVHDSAGQAVNQEITLAAAARGLALSLPNLGEQGQQLVDLSDVWGLFPGAVIQASRRYQPELVLIGRIYPISSGRWQADWLLSSANEPPQNYRWQTQGVDRQSVLVEAMQWTADLLGEQLATSLRSQQSMVSLTVDHVRELTDLVGLEGFLSQLPQVESLFIRQLTADEVVLELKVRGGMAALTEVLSRSQKLAVVQQIDPTGLTLNEAHYQWRP